MLLGFLVMTAYIPNVVGAVVPTSWVVMWILLPVYLFKCEIKLTSIHVLGLAFLTYAAISLTWSPHGYYDFFKMLIIASAFLYGANLSNYRNIAIGLALGLWVSAIIAVLQYFSINPFDIYNATPKPAGLFVNSNLFSEVSGLILILILIYKLWWFIPVTIPGLLLSTSKATAVGLAVTFIVWVWHRSKALALSCVAFIGLSTFQIDNWKSVEDRFNIWYDTISGFTFFGRGIGSFEYLFPLYATKSDMLVARPSQAHNDFLQLIFEFGIGSIFLIAAAFILLRIQNVHKYPLVFFIVIGFFGFPLYTPVSAFIAATLAGYMASRCLDYRSVSFHRRYGLSTSLQKG